MSSPTESSPTDLDFHRQSIVVADHDGPATTLLIETLRLDGHRVFHVRDLEFAAVDLALRNCHLFICGAGTGGMHAVHLIAELRDKMPDLPVLCLANALRWTRRLEGLLPADITMLREPFTRERLRAAVRPLLPLTSGGTTLAWATATRPSGGVSREETVRDT
ncbi:MAG TPA: hypothetical protein VIQ27_13215 [Gemmatimonadales bacterium]|jgi:Response regulator containing CheY-like receiver, AAA-type ATPase, and DNA-binding domains